MWDSSQSYYDTRITMTMRNTIIVMSFDDQLDTSQALTVAASWAHEAGEMVFFGVYVIPIPYNVCLQPPQGALRQKIYDMEY